MLSGIRVISFNHFHAGPMAAQFLADLGADVIAVEPVDGAFHRNWAVANRFVAGQSVNLLTTGRNKRSLALDMKSADGKAIARRLLETADAVMENFRPGAMARMGFGYEQVKAFNPGVVYASVSGYGASGPDRDLPGQDLLLQARSGLAARTGRADGAPTPTGPVIVDQHAASLLAMGILAALLGRTKSGRGCLVEGSLLQSAIDLQSESLTAWLNGARSDTPRGYHGLASWCSAGPSGIHATADGFLAISMASPADLAVALEMPALAALPASAGFDRRDEITQAVAERLAQKTTADWLPALQKQAIWHMPVKDYDDLRDDAQLAHLGTFVDTQGAEGEPVTLLGHPLRFDGAAPPVRLVPQKLGAQTRDVLREAGYDGAQIEAFVQSRTVGATAAPA
ncbi:CaiB/BaiF CoA transferase family protein [Variovorax paradoxus]|uniref:Formyl-coenzyme A transferase n=1 Tax=Variovorax paradoxus TaxID=34073 RepID=A0A0H2LUS4_VARPD|nr:CoA transferase [Variovorax paradoxus]KLN53944.1 formyl-coenzyme A transferase [Variovorax paradoxus]